MQIKCIVEERIAKITNKPYYVALIPDIEKVVFLDNRDLKLLQLIYGKDVSKS